MRPTRSATWRTVWQPAVLGSAILGSVILCGYGLEPAFALDAPEEPLAVAEEMTVPEKDVVGESVGEPAAEDAAVEGEPGPGDTVRVPPDDTGNEDESGGAVGSPVEGNGATDKPAH